MKYLFSAQFKDGSVVKQTSEDVSSTDPLRSAFYDVARRIDEVDSFHLYNAKRSYTVDLKDGHFEIDGCHFAAQPVSSPQAMPEGGKYELLYFRDVTRHFNIEPDAEKPESTSVDIAFRFGWTYTVPDGRSWTQTLVI